MSLILKTISVFLPEAVEVQFCIWLKLIKVCAAAGRDGPAFLLLSSALWFTSLIVQGAESATETWLFWGGFFVWVPPPAPKSGFFSCANDLICCVATCYCWHRSCHRKRSAKVWERSGEGRGRTILFGGSLLLGPCPLQSCQNSFMMGCKNLQFTNLSLLLSSALIMSNRAVQPLQL